MANIINGTDTGSGGLITTGDSSDELQLQTAETTALTIDSSQNVGVGTGSPAVKLDVVGQVRASTGILFGSDTAAANALDDYEEGTWTPEVADATTGGNTASGTYTGFYTKIGRVVTLNFNCTNIGTAGMTSGNTMYIRNLPFACIGSVDLQSAPGSVYANVLTLAAGEITMVFDVPDGETYGQLRTMISASAAGTITVGDVVSGQTDLRIGITYTV